MAGGATRDGRDAALHPRVDRRRVAFASLSATESRAIRAALADFQQRIAGLVPTAEEQPDLELVCEPPLDVEPDLEPVTSPAALAATEVRHV